MEQGKIYSNFVRFLPLGLFLGVSLAGLALEPEVFLFSELAVLEAGFFTAGFLAGLAEAPFSGSSVSAGLSGTSKAASTASQDSMEGRSFFSFLKRQLRNLPCADYLRPQGNTGRLVWGTQTLNTLRAV